jgi:hypothetical protein
MGRIRRTLQCRVEEGGHASRRLGRTLQCRVEEIHLIEGAPNPRGTPRYVKISITLMRVELTMTLSDMRVAPA